MDIITTILLIVGIALAASVLVFVVMVGLGAGRLSERNEQRAYVMNVLHAVESRASLDF